MKRAFGMPEDYSLDKYARTMFCKDPFLKRRPCCVETSPNVLEALVFAYCAVAKVVCEIYVDNIKKQFENQNLSNFPASRCSSVAPAKSDNGMPVLYISK